jgi:hypothetical protein
MGIEGLTIAADQIVPESEDWMDKEQRKTSDSMEAARVRHYPLTRRTKRLPEIYRIIMRPTYVEIREGTIRSLIEGSAEEPQTAEARAVTTVA